MIKAEGIEKVFGTYRALKGINLSIEENEIFGLLGPSGAGKTTLINILIGQMDPSSGKSEIYHVDSRYLTDEIYEDMGMVLDKTGLYERLTAKQNLNVYADIHNISKEKIDQLLKKVGLEHAKNIPVMKLSKGMKQRLTIARATLHNPKILFLDEPTSGLDPVTMKGIHKLIFQLKEEGTTILLTTHNMEEATKLCDRVALLNDGVICECDTPDNLSKKYDFEKDFYITTTSGEKIVLKNNPENSYNIQKLIENGEISSLHTSEPNLEKVFIHLTGRGLEE